MKSIVLAAALLLPTVVSAQTAAPAPATPVATTRLNLDTPIVTIVADPAGKAVIDTDLPGTTTSPLYEQFKGMSINQVAPMVPDKLTPAVLAKVSADLAAIK